MSSYYKTYETSATTIHVDGESKHSESANALEPEVLAPEHRQGSKAQRMERAFGPIMLGALIDCIDLATFGIPGLIAGAAAAYYICSIYGLPVRQRLLWSVIAGYYCAVPFTNLLPLATLIGAYVRYRGGK